MDRNGLTRLHFLAIARGASVTCDGPNVWNGTVDKGYWNSFAVNHDINAHSGIPGIGYLDILTPAFGTNELDFVAPRDFMEQKIHELVPPIIDAGGWLAPSYVDAFNGWDDYGSLSYGSFDNGFGGGFSGGGGGGHGEDTYAISCL